MRELGKKWRDSVDDDFDGIDDARVDAEDTCDMVLGYSVFLTF